MSSVPEAKPVPSAPAAAAEPDFPSPPLEAFVVEDDVISPESFSGRLVADLGFPDGLARTVSRNAHSNFAERHWIVDNSGSMNATDGNIVYNLDNPRAAKCIKATRWSELGHTVKTAGKLAAYTQAPTQFRLLNPPSGASQTVSVSSPGDLEQLNKTMDSSPTGATPLLRNLSSVIDDILDRAQSLSSQGKTVVLVIATDGLPSDCSQREMASKLQLLNGAPVHVVIRLCTDDNSVVDFWNEIDAQLEFPLDVLDDFIGEAQEIHSHNPWLTYGYPLHTAREFGVSEKVFDLLDEQALIPAQIREFLELAFGWRDLPQPEAQPEEFLAIVEGSLRTLPLVWDPVKKAASPWINIKKLKVRVKGDSCVVS